MIRRLADTVAAAQDRALARIPLPPLDGQVAALDAVRRARAGARRLRRLAAAFTVVGAAGAGLILWARPAPLSFDVGAARLRGVVGNRVEAPAGDPLGLHFSDGTELVLGGGASARVVALDPRGAHVVVERGDVRAAVVPRPSGSWVVAVGPFDVHVKGTRFDAGWDARRDAFTLKMYEGAVVISGRCLPEPRRSVAGELLALSCAAPRGGASQAETAAAAQDPEQPAAAVAPAPAAAVAPVLPPVPPSHGVAAAPAGGRARGALAAQAQGDDSLDSACAGAPVEDLMRLGEAARSSRRRDVATRLYRAVRDRFAGSDRAATAAFHWGQVVFDQGGSLPEARVAFEAYLAERPNGPLVQEAMGRLLEIEQQAGAREAGRQRAERYLARFPAGPHAALARTMVAP